MQDVILRHRTKVGDVDQQVRGSNEGQGNRAGTFDRTYGVTDAGESITCPIVTRKRPEISPTESASQEHGRRETNYPPDDNVEARYESSRTVPTTFPQFRPP